jgi:formate-dependent nitrite reductase membrane component NrfD
MNLFVVDPNWGWWIILYFYLGGIAAGAYFLATLVDLIGGHKDDHEIARAGYWIAFPLVILCGIFLTVDLDRPERFWHMLFKSEVVHEALEQGWPGTGKSWGTMMHAFLFKWWSPMSVGAWALLVFGVCSFLSFLGSLSADGRLAHWFRFGSLGRALQLLGSLVGFFVAAYTGALLTATNQPLWSDNAWIAALFLTSAGSTGMAAILLLTHLRSLPSREPIFRLEHADLWALGLELVVGLLFVASLGSLLPALLQLRQGWLLLGGFLVLGLIVPLALYLREELRRRSAVATAVLVLLGGFVLRYSVLTLPPEILARRPEAFASSVQASPTVAGMPDVTLVPGFSPEDGRAVGGGSGADPGNKTSETHPRSKVFP